MSMLSSPRCPHPLTSLRQPSKQKQQHSDCNVTRSGVGIARAPVGRNHRSATKAGGGQGHRRRPPRVRLCASAALDEESDLTTASSLELSSRSNYSLFVHFLHLASSYVVGHRGRTFVLVIPGEVIVNKERLYPLLEDILLLHGMGIRLVLVCGAAPQIDAYLEARGLEKRMVGAYRVTDQTALDGALEAAGATCTEVAAALSKAPSLPMVRRHARGDGQQMHFAPPVQVINGNYVTARRRGVVGGVDFQYMGQVRFVQVDAIHQQLAGGAIVLLTNIGVSASGELLNCNAYDVATHAAVELQADKLLCLTGGDVRELNLPQYLPLDDAEAMIEEAACWGREGCTFTSLDVLQEAPCSAGSYASYGTSSLGSGPGSNGTSGVGSSNGSSSSRGPGSEGGRPRDNREMSLDLDSWQSIGFPPAVLAAVVACKHGVTRAHLVDERQEGGLLLELYTRDGTEGVCMISGDIYEGIRPAQQGDINALTSLLGLLTSGSGVQLPLSVQELSGRLGDNFVIERDNKILGCCCIMDQGTALLSAASSSSPSPQQQQQQDGQQAGQTGGDEEGEGEEVRVVEICGFVVHPSYRRLGLGDSLLDYVEQTVRLRGFTRAVIVGGQGNYEWFVQRDFQPQGSACKSPLLPEARRVQLPCEPAAPLLFVKTILAPAGEEAGALPAPGKRIGF